MVVGPNILRQENESLVQSLENSRIVGLVTDDFIQHFALVFEVGQGRHSRLPTCVLAWFLT